MKKFLIVKTSALGDILHAFPVVHYLRHRFPKAQIDWVVEESGADLVRANPNISRTLVISTKQWRKHLFHSASWKDIYAFCKKLCSEKYDCVFDIQGNVKSGFITALARCKRKVGFARKSVAEWPNLLFTTDRYDPPAHHNIRDDYLSIVKQFFEDDSSNLSSAKTLLQITVEQQHAIQKIVNAPLFRNKRKIMICPGSAWPNKQVSEKTLTEFLIKLNEHYPCAFAIIWGSQQELEQAQRLQHKMSDHATIVERLPLPVLQNLMAEMDLVISMDSLPLHLAATTSTPTYSVFGASSAKKYCPQGDHHHALQGACPYGRVFEKRCPILRTCPTGLCIKGLSSEDLLRDCPIII